MLDENKRKYVHDKIVLIRESNNINRDMTNKSHPAPRSSGTAQALLPALLQALHSSFRYPSRCAWSCSEPPSTAQTGLTDIDICFYHKAHNVQGPNAKGVKHETSPS